MKCLFFLYGEKRTFETARKFWNILDIPYLDIVIHTPSTTGDHLASTDFTEVTKNDFDVLGNPKVFLYDRTINYRKETFDRTLHFSWRFLSQYLNQINKTYDYIFVGRLDSSFYVEDYSKLKLEQNKNFLFPLGTAKGNTFIQDHAFFGSYNIVKKFVDNLPNSDYWSINGDTHTNFCRYVGDNFEEKEWNLFESHHIRNTFSRYFDLYVDRYSKVFENDKNYRKFLKIFYKEFEYKLDIEYKKQYRKDWIRDYKFEENELENMYKNFSNIL